MVRRMDILIGWLLLKLIYEPGIPERQSVTAKELSLDKNVSVTEEAELCEAFEFFWKFRKNTWQLEYFNNK